MPRKEFEGESEDVQESLEPITRVDLDLLVERLTDTNQSPRIEIHNHPVPQSINTTVEAPPAAKVEVHNEAPGRAQCHGNQQSGSPIAARGQYNGQRAVVA